MYWKADQQETEKFLSLIKKHIPFVVYDLETTGKKSNVDYIVQFSANRYEVINGIYEQVDSIDLFIKPPVIMSQEVIDIHGITNEFLENKPTEDEVFPQIREFLRDAVISGYNIVKFDNKFMSELYKRMGETFEPDNVVDIYSIAKENIYPKDVKTFLLENDKENQYERNDPKLYSLSLSNVIKYLHIDEEIRFHTASEDVKATWLCAINLAKQNTRFFSYPWDKRKKADIIRMDPFKKSSTINYTYVTLCSNDGQYFKLYYDNRTKGWVSEDESTIMQLDMPSIHAKALEIAKQQGFDNLEKMNCQYKKDAA